jgi:hypothetical protein
MKIYYQLIMFSIMSINAYIVLGLISKYSVSWIGRFLEGISVGLNLFSGILCLIFLIRNNTLDK